MKLSRMGSSAVSATTVIFILAGCGGAGTGATGAVPLGATAAPIPDSAKRHTLIYVSSDDSDVYVFAYPSGKLVQTLTGFESLGDICSDSNGNVWITNGATDTYKSGTLIEYAHGGTTPIATLDDAHLPDACAVDPSTGNLAVVNGNGAASVAIYANAQGTPTYYAGGSLYGFFTASYDSTSDLFFTGYLDQNLLGTGWLQRGASALSSFTLKPHIFPHEGLQWDGQYLVVAAHTTDTNKYAIQGTMGKKAGSLSLPICCMGHFAIQGSLLVATDGGMGVVDLFHYPSAKPIKVISGVSEPNGVTISVAPSEPRIHK
jgi:hypothetical protein